MELGPWETKLMDLHFGNHFCPKYLRRERLEHVQDLSSIASGATTLPFLDSDSDSDDKMVLQVSSDEDE